MKTKNQWLEEYGSSHQHRANRLLHKVCVPLILFALIGFFTLLPLPGFRSPWANGATVLSLLCLLFYFRLGIETFLLMLAVFGGSIALALWGNESLPHPFLAYISVFVLAWIGQFLGHAVEGKRPSFFQDLQFLLIGPLWVVWGFRAPAEKN